MTRLLWAMVVARRSVALTIAAIAAVAVAAAAAGPLYLAVAAGAAREAELATAPAAERVINWTFAVDHERLPVSMRISERRQPPTMAGFDTITGFRITGGVTPPRPQATASGAGAGDTERTTTESRTGGTGTIDGAQTDARVPAGSPDPVPAWLVQRSGICDHVKLVTGRCVSGAWEVMLSERSAERLNAQVGQVITFGPEADHRYDAPAPDWGPLPADGSTRLSVVGVYAPKDATCAYWADRHYLAGGEETEHHVLFATAETLGWIRYTDAQEIIDVIPHRETFAQPGRLRTVADDAVTNGALEDAAVSTSIPDLLNRIGAGNRALSEGVRLAVVPLVLLCWLVLYLAVTNSAFRRRAETGLTGLRGVPAGTRWWLGAGEYLVPILLGTPVGLLIGYLSVVGVARWMLPSAPPVTITPLSLAFAAAAVLGAVGIGIVAQWRATSVPIVDLLRRVPGRQIRGKLGPVEVIAVALASAATYQVTTGGARAGGLALLTPMLLALAIGLLAARLVAPIAVRLARAALRRGRVSRALAGILLVRQPGQARLLSIFIVLFGLLGFAVSAADVAGQARASRSTTELGAARVLEVQALPASALLDAVRAADPSGRYAMAVAQLPGDGPPILAVDSTRLPAVARWQPGYGLSAGQAAALLRPAVPEPVRFRGTGVELRMSVTGRSPDGVRLLVQVQPDGAGNSIDYPLSVVAGREAYRVAAPACRNGCRLLGIQISSSSRLWYDVTIALHQIRQTGPDAELVGPARLADAARWELTRMPVGASKVTATRNGGGVRLTYTGNIGPQATLTAVDTPKPVPLLAATANPALAVQFGATAPPSRQVGQLRLVAGAGRHGGLIDLEYAELVGYLPGPVRRPQVWLTEDAPGQVLDRLRAEGVAVAADRSLDTERDRQERRGPALALRFYLVVATAAVLLGLGAVAVVASTERRALAAQLRALRAQGLPRAISWRVGFGGHAVLTGLAAVLGSAVAGLSWWLARQTLPLFSDGAAQSYAPDWPRPVTVLVPLLAALLVLTAAGAVAALGLRRAVERSDR